MTDTYSIDTSAPKQEKIETRGGRLNQEEFVRRSNAVHLNRYDYSEAIYKGALSKIDIICKEHGLFTQTASHHMTGSGCRKCYTEKTRYSVSDFINKASAVHKDSYSYEKTVYLNSKSKVVITCLEHGDFYQLPSQHIGGSGCPECGKKFGGWSRTRFKNLCKRNGNPLLYVIRCSGNNETFYKVGITSNDLETRFKRAGYLPYDYESLYQIEGEPDYIYDLELRLHEFLKGEKYKTSLEFGGHTECFTTIKPIEKLLIKLLDNEQIQLIA